MLSGFAPRTTSLQLLAASEISPQLTSSVSLLLVSLAAERPPVNGYFRGVTELRMYSDSGAPFWGSLLPRLTLRFRAF